MTFSTPPSSPSRTNFQTPERTAPSTPINSPPRTPLDQNTEILGQNLFASAGSSVAPQLPAPMVNTPGRISTIKDPITSKENDIQLFEKDLIAFRGDNSFKLRNTDSYQAQFFTLKKEVAESQYGKLVLKFTLKKELRLLRLDKNVEGFHHWLKNTEKFIESDKNILYTNFGYPNPRNDQANINSNDQPRPRLSQGEKDRKMLEMIQAYSLETNTEIDGYYNSAMPNAAIGSLKNESGETPLFHAELAVFDGKVFDKPKFAGRYTTEQLNRLNQTDMQIRLDAQDRIARQERKRKSRDG